MTISRTHLALGATGLAAGVALGATGLAQAADPTPRPSAGTTQDLRPGGGHRGMPFGGKLRGDHRGGYGGLVTAIDGDSLTVRTPRGTETIALNGSTAYYEGKTKATRSAVDEGDVVHVRLVDPRATKKVAAVVTVVPAHLVGWVTDVGGSTITLKDLDGFTRTIRTGSATTYVKDGATATRSAITVGTLVRALGTVDSDGTTLDATRVATGRPDKDEPRGPAGADMPMGAPMMDGPTA
jgi:endonuclease YncB( thermonuclease family)